MDKQPWRWLSETDLEWILALACSLHLGLVSQKGVQCYVCASNCILYQLCGGTYLIATRSTDTQHPEKLGRPEHLPACCIIKQSLRVLSNTRTLISESWDKGGGDFVWVILTMILDGEEMPSVQHPYLWFMFSEKLCFVFMFKWNTGCFHYCQLCLLIIHEVFFQLLLPLFLSLKDALSPQVVNAIVEYMSSSASEKVRYHHPPLTFDPHHPSFTSGLGNTCSPSSTQYL